MDKIILIYAAAVLYAGSVFASDASSMTVRKWDMLEVSVENSKKYANPFTDVEFSGWVTSPNDIRSRVNGFHDGDNIWRFRFMPDEIGEWTYNLTFSDGIDGISGSFECIKSKLGGPIQVDPSNPLWFRYADGKPFYLSAFHIWHMDRFNDKVINNVLDHAKSYGFNAIVTPHLSPEKLPWTYRSPDSGSDSEFADAIPGVIEWSKKDASKIDFNRFNLELWHDLDRILILAAKKGMIVIPFNIFGGTNGMPKIPNKTSEDLFLRYWTARWGGYWNATYQTVSEWEEAFSESSVMRINKKLAELDNNRHLISIHSLKASSPNIQKADWYSYHTVQDKLSGWDPEKYAWFADLYTGANKPIFAQECLWEGNLYQKEAGLDIENMRRGAWFIALSGGQINYADEVIAPRKYQIWGRNSAYYAANCDTAKPLGELYPYLAVLNKFMRSIPFQNLRQAGKFSSTGVCLADENKMYVAYAPKGGKISVDLSDAKGAFYVKWIDTRTGNSQSAMKINAGSVIEFIAPDTNDWVLLISKK